MADEREPLLGWLMPPLEGEKLGELLGRALTFPVLAVIGGGPLALFGTGRAEAVGTYVLLSLGLPGIALGAALALFYRSGLPCLGPRRWIAVAVLCVPAELMVHLGLRLYPWPSLLWTFPAERPVLTASMPVLLFWTVEQGNRIVVSLRFPVPDGTAQETRAWLDRRAAAMRRLLDHGHLLSARRRRAVRRSLGHTLLLRFDRRDGGTLADLHEAVGLFVEARGPEDVRGPDSVPLSDDIALFHDLTEAHRRRGIAESRVEDLDYAITLHRGLLREGGDLLSEFEVALTELELATLVLARALGLRRRREGDVELFRTRAEEATTEVRRLERLAGTESLPDRLRAEACDGLAHYHLFLGPHLSADTGPGSVEEEHRQAVERRLAHLAEAIRALELALTLFRPGALADRSRATLAHALALRHRTADGEGLPRGTASDDHAAAVDLVRASFAAESLRHRSSIEPMPMALTLAIVAAGHCADVALERDDWATAFDLGRRALDASRAVYDGTLFRSDREEALWAWQGLHDRVALAVARGAAHEPGAGRYLAGLFDWGRAVLLREALGLSHMEEQARALKATGHHELSADVAELAQRLAELEDFQLAVRDDGPWTPADPTSPSPSPVNIRSYRIGGQDLFRDRLLRARADLRALRARIAAIGDAEPAAGDPLANAVGEGPLCYLSHPAPPEDGYGPDLPGCAVVVRSDGAGGVDAEVILLPGLRGSAVVDWCRRWHEATFATDEEGEEDAWRVLEEIGTAVMEPVMRSAGWPARLVLLPDGHLGLLPLHAASVHGRDGSARRSLVHETVVSYAPTAGLLGECRARATALSSTAPHALPRRYLGVAAWDDEIQDGVQSEMKAVVRHFGDTETLLGDAATPAAVERALTRTMAEDPAPAVVHIASHAAVNNEDPLDSSFALAPGQAGDDGLLRLRDLLRIGLGEVRLTVLSACESGTPSADNANEFMSLASGFLRLGTAGVVSTLWPVEDGVSRVLIPRFFEEWSRRPADPAAALTAAQVWFATADPADIAQWVCDVTGEPLPGEVIDTLPDLQHPLCWAPCFFTGA
ncbi:CHAT domain-containing protein [Streptomyces sp. YKOK-I1]